MRIRKCLAFFLCLLISLPACVVAEEMPACQPGDTVELKFAVTANPNLAIGAALKLMYDHSAFELIPSPYVQNDAPIINIYFDGIPVGEAVGASFLVLPDAAGGVYDFEILVEQATNLNEDEVDGLAFSACRVEVVRHDADLAAENEDLRSQLEEAQRALEEAQRALEEAQRALEEERARNAAQPLFSPEADFIYEIADGTATITQYVGAGGVVSVPDTLGGYPVYAIGPSAFYKQSGLTGLILPEGVARIGVSAFYGCGDLTSVALPGSLTAINISAFYGCISLESVVIPEGVASIGVNAFSQCLRLSSVTMPRSVTSIGASAFFGCRGLTVYAPAGSYAQAYCNLNGLRCELPAAGLQGGAAQGGFSPESDFKYYIADDQAMISQYVGPGGDVVIPDTLDGYPVGSVSSSAFYNQSGVTSVVIPEGVTSIGVSAFYGCDGLTSVVIPGSVASIGVSAFCGCGSLTGVTLPEGVVSIGVNAFSKCGSLTSVTLPASVTSIGASAFSGCGEHLVLSVPGESYALQYAKNNGLNYQIQ